jgi:ribosomal-protein-alanine N-acetyltransferase
MKSGFDRRRQAGNADGKPRQNQANKESAAPLKAEDAASVDVQILSATWRDFLVILSLERVCFKGDAWPWIDVLAALTLPNAVRIKAVVAEEAVGFVIGDRRWGESLGWIASIGVHPDFRRQGIGSLLLEACEEALGTLRVRLVLRESNKAAYSLYLQQGYVLVDSWDRYYSDGEKAMVMEKSL